MLYTPALRRICVDTQLCSELIRLEAWLRRHLRDHSAWNHYLNLLRHLQRVIHPSAGQETVRPDDLSTLYCLLVRCTAFVEHMVATYPGHESSWQAVRYLVALLADAAAKPQQQAQNLQQQGTDDADLAEIRRLLMERTTWGWTGTRGEDAAVEITEPDSSPTDIMGPATEARDTIDTNKPAGFRSSFLRRCMQAAQSRLIPHSAISTAPSTNDWREFGAAVWGIIARYVCVLLGGHAVHAYTDGGFAAVP